MAKEFLSKENMPYEEFDVTKDRAALVEMVKTAGVRTVPVLVGCGEVLVGFDKDRLMQMINCMRNRSNVE